MGLVANALAVGSSLSSSSSSSSSSRSLLADATKASVSSLSSLQNGLGSGHVLLGNVLGIVTSVIFMAMYVPQFQLNARRRSTEGFSSTGIIIKVPLRFPFFLFFFFFFFFFFLVF